MKRFVFGLVLFLLGSALAEEREVWSYEVSRVLLERAERMSYHNQVGDRDPFAANEELPPVDEDDDLTGVDWLGPVVEEAGFESRFLEGAGELRDCSKRIRKFVTKGKFLGKAVYDVKNERLIVQAGLGVHREIRHAIEAEIPYQLRTTLSVYELPGVVLEDRSGFWEEIPKEAKLLRSTSWLSTPGESALVQGGDISLESEMQIDANDGYVECRTTIEVDLPGRGFSWKTGFWGVAGLRWAQEVGALDSEKTLMLVRENDFVRSNGRLVDQLILKEEGGAFMAEERLDAMRWRDPEEELKFDLGQPFQMFVVPPTFETFLVNDELSEDPQEFPELKGLKGKFLSAKRNMMNNGISFREGDFVVFHRESSRLYAKLSQANLELLHGIVHAVLEMGPPREHYMEFAEVEGDDFHKGKVLRKIGIVLLPGQAGEVALGDDLAFEAEMQVDANDELVEWRATLTEQRRDLEKAAIRTGVTARLGQPTLVQSTVVDGKKRSWVATVRMRSFDKEIDRLLKAREAGR